MPTSSGTRLTTPVADIVNCDDPNARKEASRGVAMDLITRLICGCLRFANDATDPPADYSPAVPPF